MFAGVTLEDTLYLFCRPVGIDIQQDQVVVRSHQCLGPTELGLVAMVGVSKVVVFKMPVVAVLSTGNEVSFSNL